MRHTMFDQISHTDSGQYYVIPIELTCLAFNSVQKKLLYAKKRTTFLKNWGVIIQTKMMYFPALSIEILFFLLLNKFKITFLLFACYFNVLFLRGKKTWKLIHLWLLLTAAISVFCFYLRHYKVLGCLDLYNDAK